MRTHRYHVITAPLSALVLLAFACDEPEDSGEPTPASQTRDEGELVDDRPKLAEIEAQGDERLFQSVEELDLAADVELLDGREVVHIGRARFAQGPVTLEPPDGPSALPHEHMTRDELARAFQAVSVVDGEVYRSAEPDYALADAMLHLRAVEAELVREKLESERELGLTFAPRPPDVPGTPRSIIGTDDRFAVGSPASDPWFRRIGLYTGCTGFVIGPRVALTAAHCVWSRATNNWIHGGTTFHPGHDVGNPGPWGQIWNEGDFYPIIAQAWIDVGGVENDVAILQFNNDFGYGTGWFGLDAAPNVTNVWLGNGGYPGPPPSGAYGRQWASWQEHTNASPDVSLAASYITFSLDVSGGHSGGPIVLWNTDRVFGNVTNNGSPWNFGARFNSGWIAAIDAWSTYTAAAWWGSNGYQP